MNFTSGAALAGGRNMVTYGGTKAFDMVFTEGLWVELHDKGVDVLGLVLGMTDTPALRQLEFERGRLTSLDEIPAGAVTPASVVDEAIANLGNGPTIATGDDVRMGLELFKSLSRNEVVRLIMQMSSRSHGHRRAPGELGTTMFTLRFDMRAPAIGGPTDLYAAASEMSAWAETRGCVAAVLCEHHCADDGYLPSPLLLGAAIAARTEQLMLNLVILLPLYDVARLAEDISVLDHISAGRATYVFGIGYRAEEYAHFGLSMSDRGHIADEKLGLLRRLLAGEEVEHGGRRMKVTPRPRLPEGPMMSWGGSSLAAARRAGRNGLGLLANGGVPGMQEAYEKACRDNGFEPGFALIPERDTVANCFVAEDVDAAWDEIGQYLLRDAMAYSEWNPDNQVSANITTARTIDELRQTASSHVILSVEEAKQRLAGGEMFNLSPLCGGIPPEIAWPYLKRFAELN